MNAAEIDSIAKDPPASPSSAPDPTASARAERDALASNPFVLERVRQAAEEKFIAAARAKYGDAPATRWGSLAAPAEAAVAAGPAPSRLESGGNPAAPWPAPTPAGTPEQITDRIASIRAEMAKEPGDTPRLRELHAELLKHYQQLHPAPAEGEPATEAPAPKPLALPPIPMELGGRFAYDDAALNELGPAVAAAGIPLDEIQQWVEAGHGRMTMKMLTDPATVDRLFAERFGGHVDDVLADAKRALGRLSVTTRAAVERWLDETGLSDSPAFAEWLAGHGARLGGGTP